MIFSLRKHSLSESVIEIDGTDIFCFFHSENSIHVPEQYLWMSVLTSLKLKKNVLILEQKITQIPELGHSRWLVGESFLYLAPRSSSVLLEATQKKSSTYESVKALLTHSK